MMPPPALDEKQINALIDRKVVSEQKIVAAVTAALAPRLEQLTTTSQVLAAIRDEIKKLDVGQFVDKGTLDRALGDLPKPPTNEQVALMMKRELIAALGNLTVTTNTLDPGEPARTEVKPSADGVEVVISVPRGQTGPDGGTGAPGKPGAPGADPSVGRILGLASVPAGIAAMGLMAAWAWVFRRRQGQSGEAYDDSGLREDIAAGLKGIHDALGKKVDKTDLEKTIREYIKRIRIKKDKFQPKGGDPGGAPFPADSSVPSTGVPVDDEPARQYLQLAETQGHSSVSDALYGCLSAEELDNIEGSSKSTDEEREFAKRFRRRLDERFNNLMPTVSHRTFSRGVAQGTTGLAKGYLD